MIATIERRRGEIRALCQLNKVRRLDLFGSAARGIDFTATSDVDLLAEFDAEQNGPHLREYLTLRDSLAKIVGRDIDLTMAGAVRNPFIRAEIERSRQPIYAA